ncbi:MAG TPA: MFS transporter [Solirubrobacteraceae bacterium]
MGVATEHGAVSKAGRRWVLATCCLALFITTLDNTVANVALPSIGRDLHASAEQLQWVVDSYIVVRGCLLLSAGALGDHFGRRRVFQLGLAGFGFGSLLCSVAPTAEALIAARVVQALGGCFLVPSSLAIIASAFPDPRERARAIGIWGATTGVSTGLGPVVGGALTSGVGWRSVFWINLPIVAAAIVLAARHVTETRESEPRHLDFVGQGIVLVFLVTLTSAFIEASEGGWTSPLVLALFAVALVTLPVFIVVELRREEPLLDPRLFRSPPFAGASAVALLAFVVFGGFLFVNQLFLQEVRGYSPVVAGLMLVPATVGNVVLSPLSGRITADRGPRLPVTVASLLMAAGSIALARLAADAAVPALLVAYTLIGSGLGLINAPITNAAVSGLPTDRAGVAGAVTSTFRQIGVSLGVALLGTLAFTAGAGGTAGHVVGPGFVTGLHHAYACAATAALLCAAVGATAFRARAA